MEIVTLSKEEFDAFASTHPNRNFYQTSEYGTLMSRHGFEDVYIGYLSDNSKLEAASLILTRRALGNTYIGYAPRGFLVDYENPILLANFSNTLRKYLQKKGYIYVTIDPYVVNIKRGENGQPLETSDRSNILLQRMKELGYVHQGFNTYFETLKPRWNMITKVDPSINLFSKLEKSTRSKIRSLNSSGVHIYRGTADDIILFYNLIQKKHTKRDLNYYLDYYETFNKKNMFEIYFAALNPSEYLISCRKRYEEELESNNEIVTFMENNVNIEENTINKKIESDRLLNIYQKNLIFATDLLKKHKENILLNTTAVIKYGKEIFFLIDGFNPKHKSLSAAPLLKWSIMDKYAKEGYQTIHHNGITGDFNKYNKYYGLYQFKKAFDAEIVEYIGEFNFVINHRIYSTYQGVKPLNTFISKLFKK